jgi:hypothetical protein
MILIKLLELDPSTTLWIEIKMGTLIHLKLLEILYYATIEFATTCDYLSFATMFYHFYN